MRRACSYAKLGAPEIKAMHSWLGDWLAGWLAGEQLVRGWLAAGRGG